MQLSPELRAMLADPAALQSGQDCHAAALSAWRDDPAVAGVLGSFSAYAHGAALSALPQLAALFSSENGAGTAFAATLVARLLPAPSAAPLGQVPLRHARERRHASVLLAREVDAALTLVAFDPAGLLAAPPPPSAAFATGEEWDVVVAGRGAGRLVQSRDNGLVIHPLALAPGTALGRDGSREALLVDRAEHGAGLVLLRLQRRLPGALPAREYDLATGTLIHQSDPTPRTSRHDVAIALLARMGRTDAAPWLAEISTETDRGDSLRWNALCQCLGLDTALGFRTLATIASHPDDPLGPMARTLRAQLVEQHPVLAEVA
ncbi:MAG: hypothetical protein V4579_00320 [Pseudomonadota bacterium]